MITPVLTPLFTLPYSYGCMHVSRLHACVCVTAPACRSSRSLHACVTAARMCKRLKRLLHAVSSTDEDDMMPTASNVRGASAALPPHVLATVTSDPHPHSTHRKHPRPHSCRRRPAWPLSIIDAPSVPPSAHHAIIIPAEHGLYHCCLSPRLSPTRCTHRPSPFCPALSCSRP